MVISDGCNFRGALSLRPLKYNIPKYFSNVLAFADMFDFQTYRSTAGHMRSMFVICTFVVGTSIAVDARAVRRVLIRKRTPPVTHAFVFAFILGACKVCTAEVALRAVSPRQ